MKGKKYWIRKNDDLAREINRIRAKNTCERCGKSGEAWQMHWAHIFGRETKSMRWDEDNALLLCAQCHFWNHDYPTLYDEWLESKIGKARCKKLEQKYNLCKKMTLMDYVKINERLHKQLSLYKTLN